MIADAVECTALSGALSGRVQLQPLEPFDVALCPVRIAWAERDRTIPYRRYGHPMRAKVPGAEFITLPGVGHVPMSEQPATMDEALGELLRRCDDHVQGALRPRRRA